MTITTFAPGWPGIPARWTSSAKSAVGTALQPQSRVWFSISHGILNEIYYPRIDQACTRDVGILLADGHEYFSEEKRDAFSTIQPIIDGVPAFRITSTCRQGRYRLEKLVLADPRRDVLLQQLKVRALAGPLDSLRLYVLIAPHLVNKGAGNTGWVADYKGAPMLFAEGGGTTLALGCSAPLLTRSVGFVGVSDGWQDLRQHFELRWRHDFAVNGNVALVAQVDLGACDGDFVLALGFGRTAAEAALHVRTSLNHGVDEAVGEYAKEWQAWQATLVPLDDVSPLVGHNTYRISTAVLRVHEGRTFTGSYIASLSVPWGSAKGDEDLGGYHLAWPRDLVETAGGLLAAGARNEARQVIGYLQGIQESDGHWPQNCWLDGTPYWNGTQLDETAFPILLVDLALREDALSGADLPRVWPMVASAAGFIVCNGPVTSQDRWEEDAGYSPFTLAVEIAALLAAADIADRLGQRRIAGYLRESADVWNSMVERWTYASDTMMSRLAGVEGYYVRIAPPEVVEAAKPLSGCVPIKNRPPQFAYEPASLVVSPDALALVRFGLRAADDPRILNTIKVIDALLKVDLPAGPCWHRYNADGYGEHDDGRPFDGTGIGRPWPLLTGERAHYELAAGNVAAAQALLAALEGFASDGHLLPEQVWNAPDIPEQGLYFGRPSGSAMPLAWAHAEHVKLLRSLSDGRVFDMPAQPRERYQVQGVKPRHSVWRFNIKCRQMTPGHLLRIEVLAPATVHWSTDDWRTVTDTPTQESGLGIHYADLDTTDLPEGNHVVFTFLWKRDERWEGRDYRVAVA